MNIDIRLRVVYHLDSCLDQDMPDKVEYPLIEVALSEHRRALCVLEIFYPGYGYWKSVEVEGV